LALAHWAEPVRFTELIENLYAAGVRLFVESGPRGNLSAFVEDILRGRPFAALPANLARRSGVTQVNHLLGRLAAHNVPLQLTALYEQRAPRRLAWPPHAVGVRRAVPAPLPLAQPATADPRGRVLTQYFGVMEQFLDMQQEMTELFLRSRRPLRPVLQEKHSPSELARAG